MSLHCKSLRLAHIKDDPDLLYCTCLMADGEPEIISFFEIVRQSVGSQPAYFNFLQVLDAKHLYGARVAWLCHDYFQNLVSEAFMNHVYDKLPCQLCQEKVKGEELIGRYEKLIADQTFFAEKFKPGLRINQVNRDFFEVEPLIGLREELSYYEVARAGKIGGAMPRPQLVGREQQQEINTTLLYQIIDHLQGNQRPSRRR